MVRTIYIYSNNKINSYYELLYKNLTVNYPNQVFEIYLI